MSLSSSFRLQVPNNFGSTGSGSATLGIIPPTDFSGYPAYSIARYPARNIRLSCSQYPVKAGLIPDLGKTGYPANRICVHPQYCKPKLPLFYSSVFSQRHWKPKVPKSVCALLLLNYA